MQINSKEVESRNIYPELQHLCDFLNRGYGGFDGLIAAEFSDPPLEGLSKLAVASNKGRTLYPELQYLCDYLNSGRRLF